MTTEQNTTDTMESSELKGYRSNGLAKYLVVNVVSKRCKQIVAGERRLVAMDNPCHSLADVVVKEMENDKLTIRSISGNELVRPKL